MKLQLVSFEQAQALKELGFSQSNDNCQVYYQLNGQVNCVHFNYFVSLVRYGGIPENANACRAPELELAAKWLREEKQFGIFPIRKPAYNSGKWYDKYTFHLVLPHSFFEKDNNGICSSVDNNGEYDSYESALSAGIDLAIELINKYGKEYFSTQT